MRHSAFIAAAIGLLAGCASTPKGEQPLSPSPTTPSVELVQAAQLASYAQSLQTVVQGTPTQQAEIMASARAGYENAKLGPGALRYGLLLAAPGHPQRDAVLAQRVLRETLARTDLLTTGERALGIVELARVDAEVRQANEIERLVTELQQEREKQRAAPATNQALQTANRRLQQEIEESARLRKQLDEARAKLDAITRMERNSDRPPPKDDPK
jgi:flagellar biosynthesis GTPase FlhF